MTNTMLTMFCVTRNLRMESAVLNQITATITTPCCQGCCSQLLFRNWSMVTIRSAVAIMTRMPGRGGSRRGDDRAGHRHRWIDPPARVAVRRGGHEANLRARQPLRPDRV